MTLTDLAATGPRPLIAAVEALRDRDFDTVVLVEGLSDKVAVETLAPLGPGVEVVPMGGATNVRRFAEVFAAVRLLGLCDAGEAPTFAHHLDTFFVCSADLEDELIRALGTDAVEAVLAAEGQLRSFRLLQQQPDQRGRPHEQQLRRFFGAHSGAKIRYAKLLVEALETVPDPLAALLAAL